MPAAASSQTDAARAREHEVGRRERGAEVVGERRRAGSRRASRARASDVVVALAATGAARPAPPRRTPRRASSLSARAPWRAAERRAAPAPRAAARSTARASSRCTAAASARDRPAGDAVLGAVAAVDRERQEDAPRERRGEPVREPEVRVRLRQRRRDPPPPARRAPSARRRSRRRRARRPGVAASRIRRAGARRADGGQQRAREREPGPPRQPETRKASNSKPASGTSRASTRSGDPANVTRTPRRPQLLRDCERGQHVPGRPPGCDQAPERLLRSIGRDVKEDADRRERDDEARPAVRTRTAAGSRSAARARARPRG